MQISVTDGIRLDAAASHIRLTKSQQDLTASVNLFAFKLFNQVRNSRSEESILLSPFSASMALGMASTGAEGETEKQMLSVLGFENTSKEEMAEYYSTMLVGLAKADPYVNLKIANSIWVDNAFPVKEDFVKNCWESFDAVALNRDFHSPSTLKEINDWVSEKTDGTIKDFLDKLDPNSKIALINALSFEGKWRYAFPESKKTSFMNASGKKKRTDMMHAIGDLYYGNNSGWELLRLPYGANAFSMLIILPPEEEDFKKTILENSILQSLFTSIRLCNVNMNIPSFISQDSHDLIEPLKAMGMTAPFGEACFPGISDEPLTIGTVNQRNSIEVNETGTKATAATEVQLISYLNLPDPNQERRKPESINFDADRPFYYLIIEESTDTILFIGQLTEP